jgi:hypothetical protein
MAYALEGVVKAGCEEEVFSEILAGDSWTSTVSPPMTPGKLYNNGYHTIASRMTRGNYLFYHFEMS